MSAHCSRALDALRKGCPCLQSAGGFVVVMCLFAMFHQMVTSGLVSAVLSTLERRYGLSSVQSGTLLSTYDFVKVCLVIPVSYVGGKGHIPRNMAVCCFILSMGCLLFCSAELFSDRYMPSGGTSDVCTATLPSCSASPTSGFYYLLLFGQGLMALGGTAPYAIGPAYILSNSEPKKALAFMGAFYAATALGPAIGFLGGGALLNGWVDPSGLPARYEGLTSSDPLWVGNWWAGILLAGMAILCLIPFFLVMPKRMPTAPHHERHEPEVAISLHDLWGMIKSVLTNPQWWLVTLAVTSESFAVSGYTGFGPKYMQTQFGLQAGTASILSGGGIVPAAVIGMFIGGWWDGKRHTKLSQTAIFNTKMAAISTVFVMVISAIGCDNVAVQGVSLSPPYDLALAQGCNAGCACNGVYTPVCGNDGVSYFNPCYAGCANYTVATSTYESCRCVGSSQTNVTANLANATALGGGTCSSDCGTMLGLFMLFFFLFLLFTFMNHTPSTAILMRIVPVSQKSLSLGLNDAVYKLLGTIPGPLSFGSVFDHSCIITAESCGTDAGDCVLYDNAKLRLILFLVIGGLFKLLSTSFNLASIKSIRMKEMRLEADSRLVSSASDPGHETTAMGDLELQPTGKTETVSPVPDGGAAAAAVPAPSSESLPSGDGSSSGASPAPAVGDSPGSSPAPASPAPASGEPPSSSPTSAIDAAAPSEGSAVTSS